MPYSGFEAKYTKNLQSSKYIGDNKIITKLCPLGEGSLNIKDVNDGSIWLENHSYTMSVLEGIENNDDIYEQDQLKAWGERKLAELCKPRKELTLTTAMLNKVEGYELEEVHLNDIVDVIDYEFTDQPSIQLRVIEYKHYLWNGADAELVIGDITLESTDIFKKTIQATNLINNGTLDTSKVVDYYKNGQSLRKTLRQIDQTIVETTSTLEEADDQIRASVQQTETRVDNLNNDIVSQDLKISQLIINVDGITSEVNSILDLTETITSYNGKIVLEDAVEGPLVGLSIHGYDGYVTQFPSDDLYPSDTLYPILSQIKLTIKTLNLCPIDTSKWHNSAENILESDFIGVDSDYVYYASLKGEVYGAKYYLGDIQSFDENGNRIKYIGSDQYYGKTGSELYSSSATYLQYGWTKSLKLYLLPGTKKIKIHVVKVSMETDVSKIYGVTLLPILPSDIEYAKPMLEKCDKIIGTSTLSGELSDEYMRVDCVGTVKILPFDVAMKRTIGWNFLYIFSNLSGFEITYKEKSNLQSNGNSCVLSTLYRLNEPYQGVIFYNQYEHNYKHKRLYWNKTWYDIYTENDYYDVKTTVEFTNTYFQGERIYTLNIRDEQGHSETFDLDLPQEEFQCRGIFCDLASRFDYSGTPNTGEHPDSMACNFYGFNTCFRWFCYL